MGLGLAYAARPLPPSLAVGQVWQGVRPYMCCMGSCTVRITAVPSRRGWGIHDAVADGIVELACCPPVRSADTDVYLDRYMLRNATLVTPAPDRSWIDRLRALGACEAGMEFAAQFETWQACWDTCRRWYWLEWAVRRIHGEAARRIAYEAVLEAFLEDCGDGWRGRACDAVRALYPVAPELPAVKP